MKSKKTVDLSGGQRLTVISSGGGAADFVIVTDHPNPIVWAFCSTWEYISKKRLPFNKYHFFGEMAQAVLKTKLIPEDESNDLMLIRVCVEAGRSLLENAFTHHTKKLRQLRLQHQESSKSNTTGSAGSR